MSSLSRLLVVIGTIAGSMLLGQLLYYRYYSESRGIESLFRIVLNTILVLAGISTIIGGHYVPGAIVLMLGWYFWLSNRRRVGESDIATDTVRSTLANFRPSSGRRR